MTTTRFDPSVPVWEAVATLEQEHYTKREIADVLREVADDVEPHHA